MRLRHRAVESDRTRLLYEYQLECQVGLNTLTLPDWFEVMNADCLVQVSPFRHFGVGWGEVLGGELQVTVNSAGTYNALVLGTRSDPQALDEFALYGVEYQDPNVSTQ